RDLRAPRLDHRRLVIAEHRLVAATTTEPGETRVGLLVQRGPIELGVPIAEITNDPRVTLEALLTERLTDRLVNELRVIVVDDTLDPHFPVRLHAVLHPARGEPDLAFRRQLDKAIDRRR